MKRLIPKVFLIGAVILTPTLSSWADEESFTIAPAEHYASELGDSVTIAVTAARHIDWTAESLVPWITITGSNAGNGNDVQRNFPAGGQTWFLRASEE